MIRVFSKKLYQYKKVIENVGLASAVFNKLQRLRNRFSKTEKLLKLYSKHTQFPLKCRPNTSDLDVFYQIVVGHEYRCLDDVRNVGLIIDCGANVGYSAAYFLSRFPEACLIAIEPDPENFAILEANLAPYRGRYFAICSAVWSKPVGLVLSEIPFSDGREWARTVREVRGGEQPTMIAVDIWTLLNDSRFERISILKIDIEGAEAVVFSSNYEHWVKQVDNLVVELHNDECRSNFEKAIATEKFVVSQCDELTVCRRPAHLNV